MIGWKRIVVTVGEKIGKTHLSYGQGAAAELVAMGTIFAMANPEAAVRMLWAQYPQTKPVSKEGDAALQDGLRPLTARFHSFELTSGGVTKWGESSLANYDAYVDFLVKWKIVPQKVAAGDLVTNDLIDEVNHFDLAAVAAQAKAWKP